MKARRALTLTLALAALLSTAATLLLASSALAAGPWWHLDSGSRPASIPAEGSGELALSAENVGEADFLGQVTLADSLPSGLRATAISGSGPKQGGALGETTPLSCSLEYLSCEALGPIAPFDTIEVRIGVEALPGAKPSEANTLEVSGGSAPPAKITRPVSIGEAPGFGIEAYELQAEAEGGGPVTQAAGHPFQITGSIMLDQGPDEAQLTSPPSAGPIGSARDVIARLPPGLVANPTAVARCLPYQFVAADEREEADGCSYESAVGAASITLGYKGQTRTVPTPIFNIEPEAGEPARFGFFVPFDRIPVYLTTSVRSEEDWGVDLSSSEIPRDSGISSVALTFWGVAGSALHDESRGFGCLAEARARIDLYEECKHFEEAEPPAFLTLPSSCTSSLATSLQADSWEAPGSFLSFPATEPLAALSGCEAVPFSPSISTTTTSPAASSPSGFAFDLSFDRAGLTSSTSVAQSNLENTVVSLPEGLTIDPSAGVGLGACSPQQYAAGACPEDSKLGTVEVETPLLFTTVYGSLYLATPFENPFSEPGHPNGSMIALYVIARSRAERGILVKLAGKVSADPSTGRLTVSFEDDPPLQFERFNFHFREGAQAPLITPSTCGSYTTTAELYPYARPEQALTDTASFNISSGSEGSACPQGLPPFAPTIKAGTLTNHAGVFAPLYVELARSDAMQYIASYSTVLPIGLTANLTGVPQCPTSDIELSRHKTGTQELSDPSCPEGSLIGHSLVGTGVGSILDYVPGKLYLSGPFRGDPLSVVSITSAVVGPFDLGTVVVRFGLHIDPDTAQVSIDPSGSEPIPTIIDGIVTHVRDIKVSIDRPNFTLNPTSCEARPISSTLVSSLGVPSRSETNLQAEACNELEFKPTFTASTSGKTSRADGASLTVKLKMPLKPGKDSNIKSVKVELPKALPARLTTLQQACTEAQFNKDPLGCPKASMIGYAKAQTPILPEPLQGPAIFVSHGGAAFPSLILHLQGYGFTIDIVGSTFVSRTGILSATFSAIPDEPVGSFELSMPEGPYSALAATTDLCKEKGVLHLRKKVIRKVKGHKRRVKITITKRVAGELFMPTLFSAQNGIKIKAQTPIAVTGCGRRASRKGRDRHRHRRGRHGHKPGHG